MKNILTLTAAVFTASLTSCIPVEYNDGQQMPPPGSHEPQHNSMRSYRPIDRGVIQHGDPRQHRYGNGPQSYIRGFPPPGGYDPNYNYGFGGYKEDSDDEEYD